MAKMSCTFCGKEIEETSSFCEHCGKCVSTTNQEGFIKRYLKPSTTEENIENLFLIAKVIRMLHVIAGVIIFFVALVGLLDGRDEALAMLFTLIPLAISAFFSPILVEWQGHLLRNISEINYSKKK